MLELLGVGGSLKSESRSQGCHRRGALHEVSAEVNWRTDVIRLHSHAVGEAEMPL